jgi:hypothetical protein
MSIKTHTRILNKGPLSFMLACLRTCYQRMTFYRLKWMSFSKHKWVLSTITDTAQLCWRISQTSESAGRQDIGLVADGWVSRRVIPPHAPVSQSVSVFWIYRETCPFEFKREKVKWFVWRLKSCNVSALILDIILPEQRGASIKGIHSDFISVCTSSDL